MVLACIFLGMVQNIFLKLFLISRRVQIDLAMTLQNSFSGKEILNWRNFQLAKGGKSVDIDWLLDLGGGLSWSDLQMLKISQERNFHLDLSLQELSIIWMRFLDQKIPLQYQVGRCPWRDFEVEVNSSVLIPRQETELLIDIALNKIESGKQETGKWVDLGTGSGALAIALARSLPKWTGHAVDCSEQALFLAKKNIEKLVADSTIDLHLGNWWDPLSKSLGTFDLVIANPPYIPESEVGRLDSLVRDHEPHLALSGGIDGLSCFREIIQGSLFGLRKGGWLMVEHNYDQSEVILNILKRHGFLDVEFRKDLEGIRRFALGRHP